MVVLVFVGYHENKQKMSISVYLIKKANLQHLKIKDKQSNSRGKKILVVDISPTRYLKMKMQLQNEFHPIVYLCDMG